MDRGSWVDSNPWKVRSGAKTRVLLEFPNAREETGPPEAELQPSGSAGGTERVGLSVVDILEHRLRRPEVDN